MDVEPRLEDLLAQWQRLRQGGRAVLPAELCHDCPELLPELERRILEDSSLATGTPQTLAYHLFLHWHSLRSKGENVSAQQLCREHPELREEVERLIAEGSRSTRDYTPRLGPSESGRDARPVESPR